MHDEVAAGVDADHPCFVGVRYEPDGLAIHSRPCPTAGPDPLACLVGWRAPADWDAFGVSAPGSLPGMPDPSPATTVVVHRSTLLVERCHPGFLLLDAEEPLPAPRCDTLDAVIDVVCRALGRPSPPPERTPAAWLELRWLDAIAEAAPPARAALAWADVAMLHPLADGSPVDPETLAVATLTNEQYTTWRFLREHSAVPAGVALPPPGGRSLPTAEWFDDGSFARWVHRDLPDPYEAADAVLSNVAEEVAARIVQALVAL